MRRFQLLPILIVLFSVFCRSSYGFYVPGVAPQDFSKGDLVEVKVRTITQSKILTVLLVM